MKVKVDAGYFFTASSGSLTSIPATRSGLFVTPVTDNRIDRLLMTSRGTLSIVKGTCNPSPTPPTIPGGKFPVCAVSLTIGTSEIVNSQITDERVSSMLVVSTSGRAVYENADSPATWTCPQGVTTIYVTACAGGGGGASAYVSGGVWNAGGGGTAGQHKLKQSYTVVPGTDYACTIGGPGAAGGAGGLNNGGTGGNTRIATLFTLTGGAGGQHSVGFTGATYAWSLPGLGGVLGSGGRGSLIQGGAGQYAEAASGYGGGGGGAAIIAFGTTGQQGGQGGYGILVIEW